MAAPRLVWKNAARGYAELAHWVRGALDLYRPDLRACLFPVFAAAVCRLALEGHADACARLLEAHGPAHAGAFGDELAQLRLLVSPEHVRANAFARRVIGKGKSFTVHLSSTAAMLLQAFLDEVKLHEINHLLHTHVALRTTYVHPSDLAAAAESVGGAAGTDAAGAGDAAPASSSSSSSSRKRGAPPTGSVSGESVTGMSDAARQSVNEKDLDWGVKPKRARPNEVERTRALKHNLKELLADDKNTMGLKKKTRQARANALRAEIEAAKHRSRRPLWVGAHGPVPGLRDEFYRDMVEKLLVRVKPVQARAEGDDLLACCKLGYAVDHKRAELAWAEEHGLASNALEQSVAALQADEADGISRPELPSVACYALHHNYDSLACTAVSRDGVQAAGGYSDGVVRVWRLDGGKHLGYTYGHAKQAKEEDSPMAAGSAESDAVLVGHSMGVTGCCFSPVRVLCVCVSVCVCAPARALFLLPGDLMADPPAGPGLFSVSLLFFPAFPGQRVDAQLLRGQLDPTVELGDAHHRVRLPELGGEPAPAVGRGVRAAGVLFR